MKTIRLVAVAACTIYVPAIALAEPFVDVGAQASRIEARIANADGTVDTTETGGHIGLGFFRRVSERNELGVRVELDNLGSDLLLAVRAVDWRYTMSERLSVGGFLGAARLDLATPAYGYYFGGGIQIRNVVPRWDLGIDMRYGDKIARDNVLPTDPQGGSPDNFYDLLGVSVYLSRRF